MERASLAQISVDPFSLEFKQIVDSLKSSFQRGKGIPLSLVVNGEEPKYFASTTATTLLCLHFARLLNREEYEHYYEALFYLKDNKVNYDDVGKYDKDFDAWDVAEGASVWTTALAIWALLGTGYNGNKFDIIRKAALWLASRYNRESNWGPNCPDGENFFISACVIHAIRLVLKSPFVHLEREQRDLFSTIISESIISVRKKRKWKSPRLCYWSLPNEAEMADPTSTITAIWMLHEENSGSTEDKNLTDGGIRYLRSALQSNEAIWDFHAVFTQYPQGAKAARVGRSFTPSFIIILLQLGISPYDKLCTEIVKWLKENVWKEKDIAFGWSMTKNPHDGIPFSFSTAYGIWAITMWSRRLHRFALNSNAVQKRIIGSYKRRIEVLLLLVVILLIVLIMIYFNLTFSQIVSSTQNFILYISAESPLIQRIGGIIVAIASVFTLFRYNERISAILHSIGKNLRRGVYGDRE